MILSNSDVFSCSLILGVASNNLILGGLLGKITLPVFQSFIGLVVAPRNLPTVCRADVLSWDINLFKAFVSLQRASLALVDHHVKKHWGRSHGCCCNQLLNLIFAVSFAILCGSTNMLIFLLFFVWL